MNLNVSPVNYNSYTNNVKRSPVNFGLAKFSEAGMNSAKSCTDVYVALGMPSSYTEVSEFCKKKGFGKAPFTKFINSTCKEKPTGEAGKIIADEMTKCGTSSNAVANAFFVKQLLASKSAIEKKDAATQDEIRKAAQTVFDANWNNPELSKKETLELLDFIKPNLDDKEYVVLSGVIQNCDQK